MEQAAASGEARVMVVEEVEEAFEEDVNESGYPHGEEQEDDDHDDYDDYDDEYNSDDEDDSHDNGAVVRGPCDASRMELSEQERQWAIAVKRGIEGSPEIDNLSDFMYVQLALVHHENVEKALECAHTLQHTRQEYSLLDSFEEGLLIQQKMFQLFPGMYLSFSYAYDEGCYAMVLDICKFTPSVLNSKESMRTWIASCFYVSHSMTPDFASARVGCVYIAECEGYNWKSNMLDLKTSEMYWDAFGSVYPLLVHKMKCFHTPMLFNVLHSMNKRFVPEEYFAKVEVGCQYHGRLDSLYLVPTPEVATQRLLGRLAECVQRRYANDQAFQL
jgi:CRAL/TRIO domain